VVTFPFVSDDHRRDCGPPPEESTGPRAFGAVRRANPFPFSLLLVCVRAHNRVSWGGICFLVASIPTSQFLFPRPPSALLIWGSLVCLPPECGGQVAATRFPDPCGRRSLGLSFFFHPPSPFFWGVFFLCSPGLCFQSWLVVFYCLSCF